MFTDSTGYLICGGFCIAGIIIGVGAITAGFEILNQHTQYRNSGSEGEFAIDWGSVAIEASYAMGFTALTVLSAGTSSWGMNWYFYSRMAMAATYSVGRGLYDGKSAGVIVANTVSSLILTAIFVRAGNKPMSIGLIDYVGYSPIGTFGILSAVQIGRRSVRMVQDNFDTVKQNLGIDESTSTNYYRFD